MMNSDEEGLENDGSIDFKYYLNLTENRDLCSPTTITNSQEMILEYDKMKEEEIQRIIIIKDEEDFEDEEEEGANMKFEMEIEKKFKKNLGFYRRLIERHEKVLTNLEEYSTNHWPHYFLSNLIDGIQYCGTNLPCPFPETGSHGGSHSCIVRKHQRHSIDHILKCHWPQLLHQYDRCLHNFTHLVPRKQNEMKKHHVSCKDLADWNKRKSQPDGYSLLVLTWNREEFLKVQSNLEEFTAKKLKKEAEEKKNLNSITRKDLSLSLRKKQIDMMSPKLVSDLRLSVVYKLRQKLTEEKFETTYPVPQCHTNLLFETLNIGIGNLMTKH